MNSICRLVVAAPLVGLALSCASTAAGHPFYASIAEMEWNRETGCLEVAVRLDPEDLEAALRMSCGRRIVLEKEPKLDELLATYTQKSFFVRPRLSENGRKQNPVKLKWVGHELTPTYVWIYFELPLPDGTRAIDIRQVMFVEVAPQQVNTVTVRFGKRFLSVNCTKDRDEQTIVFPAPLRRAARSAQ